MQFVNPAFLFGLTAIAIPVIIHLFNFRRFRKVYFTNVRFIKELKMETQKRSRLRHLIILFLRIIAIAALALAFSQPYIPFKENQAPISSRNAVSIFVDNSFSMEAIGSNGSLLDEAKQKAKEIVSAYKPSDFFQLLTNDFEGRHQRLVTRDEFLNLLEEVKPGASSHKLAEIVGRQNDVLSANQSARRTSFIISDFQKSEYVFGGTRRDSSVTTYLIPLKPNMQGNVYIDTCWFDLPLQQVGQTAVLNARIWNKSDKDLEKIPVKLEINGSQRAVASVDIKPGASVEVKMPFTNYKAGIQQGSVEVTDYPVVYDDKFFLSYEVTNSINILAINGKEPNRFLDALFSQDSAIRMINLSEKSLDYSKLSSYSLIILNELTSISSGLAEELRKYIENGGAIAMLPAVSADLPSYNSFLLSLKCPQYAAIDTVDSKVVKLNTESPIFRDVFEKSNGAGQGLSENTELPLVMKHLPLFSPSVTQTQSLIRMLNGHDLLALTNVSLGQVYQFAIPLDPAFSNFPRQAIFVPAMYNIALMSRPPVRLYYIIGQNDAVRVNHSAPVGDKVFRIRALKGNFELIPEHKRVGALTNVFVNNQLTQAGNYLLYAEQEPIAGLSFNYNRDESDPACLTQAEIEEQISQARLSNFSLLKADHKPVNEILQEMNYGHQLWKYFIWMALICLLAEVILLRAWKH
ncbi:MAG: BatA domain-containing protein [Bacteroidetes bacterium]|nr:BatA domain-containing protein [Bacteroidota bacterium]